MWASIVLTAAYSVAMALLPHLPEPDLQTEVEDLVLFEALFAGPMLIGSGLSVLMRRIEARRLIIGLQTTYIVITFMTFQSTFSGEGDAQYQLELLLIPLIGYGGLLLAAVLVAVTWLASRFD
jgi:hypothetical protein